MALTRCQRSPIGSFGKLFDRNKVCVFGTHSRLFDPTNLIFDIVKEIVNRFEMIARS